MPEEHRPYPRSRIRRRRVQVAFDEDALHALASIVTKWRIDSGIFWQRTDLIREAVNQFITREQEHQQHLRP